MVLQVLENGPIPADPVRVEIGGTSRNHLDIWVGPAHQFRGFESVLSVIFSGAMAHLPRPIHLVPQPPILDTPGLIPTVLLPQPGHCRIAGVVHILDPLLGFVPGSGAQVGANVWLRSHSLYIVKKLVRAESVVLNGAPSHLEPFRALVTRPDPVFPVVVGGEVAAWPTEQRDAEVLTSLQNVFAEAFLIGQFRA